MHRWPENWHIPAFGNFCVASRRSFASRACWRCRRRFSFFRFSFAACLPRGFRDFMLPYQGEQGSGSTRRTPAIHANYTPINAPTPEVWGQRTRTPRARILASHTRLTCAMKPTCPRMAQPSRAQEPLEHAQPMSTRCLMSERWGQEAHTC